MGTVRSAGVCGWLEMKKGSWRLPLVFRVPKNRALTPLNLNQQSVSQFNCYIYCFYLAECFFIVIGYIRAFTVPILKVFIYQCIE